MKRSVFHDSEQLSHALQHTDVSAMQISKGRFQGELSQYGVDGWSVQHVSFSEGRAACRGSSPAHLHALVIPLSLSAHFRLLGQEVTRSSFGFYAPRSEHGDTTGPGASEVVLVPPAGLIEQVERDLELILPRAGSYHQEAPEQILDGMREVLKDVHRAACADASLLSQTPIARTFADRLNEQVYALLPHVEHRGARGRPQLPRSAILRRLNERLVTIGDEPISATDLCNELGISFPTLRRIFIEWYGVSPAKYLLLHRYYLARRLLSNRSYDSVTSVAHACGFWDLSRFSANYRALFHELPSATLRKQCASGPPK
jgi:AraC family ethanolamine operon transcriptional activator